LVRKITVIRTSFCTQPRTSFRRERTSAGSHVASVYSTINVIVASKNMNATRVGIARVVRTRIAVAAIVRRVNATFEGIARVTFTLVEIVAHAFREVDRHARTVHARVGQTNVEIQTNFRFQTTTGVNVARG